MGVYPHEPHCISPKVTPSLSPSQRPSFFNGERPAGEIAGNVYYLNVGILPTMNPRVFVAYQTGTIC